MEKRYVFLKPWFLDSKWCNEGDTIKVEFFRDHRLGQCYVEGFAFSNIMRADYFRFLLGKEIIKPCDFGIR